MTKLLHPPRYRRSSAVLLAALLVLAVAAFALSALCGADGCSPRALQAEGLWRLRLPRASSGLAVGALLSLAGALLQLLLRNPLADPYILGVSGGAAVGALLSSLLLPAAFSVLGLQAGALAGALLATVLLFLLAHRSLAALPLSNAVPGVSLILTGVMISAGFGALTSLLLSLSPDAQLRGALFWLMGDLDVDSYGLPAWGVLLLAGAWSVRSAPQLNVLVHGEAAAHLLGLPVRRLRITILAVASLATAAAVSLAGAIGFVGLVIPHLLRLVIGNDQRLLLPAAMLAGGTALVLADLAARSAVAPLQLPVGVVTALVGVPVFLALLLRRR
ncbi:MAG: iron ABC transporter permease [Burkholderiaceae bacterium]|nr:iron ABC transporter permease [Burkholderiaceae bacterium]